MKMSPIKSVKEQWEMLVASSRAKGISPEIIEQHRHTFYTGYMAMLSTTTNMICDDDMDRDDVLRECGHLVIEVGAYMLATGKDKPTTEEATH